MLNTVILVFAAVLCGIGLLYGLKRGFFSSLVRFGVVVGMAVLAFFLATPVTSYVLGIQVTYESTVMSLQEVIETTLMHTEGITDILEMSPTMQQLVFHLPQVLIKELVFVLMFFLFCFLSWPIYAIIYKIVSSIVEESRAARGDEERATAKSKQVASAKEVATDNEPEAGKKPKKAKTKTHSKKRRGKFRLGGMLVGAVQGVFCFCVIMTLVLGFSSFASHFNDAFADSEIEEISSITGVIDEEFLSPLQQNKLMSVLHVFGVDKVCTKTFHELSSVEIGATEEDRHTVYYFDTLEGMFEPVSALLVIKNMDINNMTDGDFSSLGDAIGKVQNSEEAKEIVKEVVQSTVTDLVNESYKDSATVIVDRFVDNLLDTDNVSETVDVKKETEAITNIFKVLDDAANSDATHAFEQVNADEIVDTVLESTVIYETLIEIANEPEVVDSIRNMVNIPEDAKNSSASSLVDYRDNAKETLTAEEYEKLSAVVDSVAEILGLDLSAVGGLGELPDTLPDNIPTIPLP